MSNMCLVVTPAIEELASKIQQEYPEACQRNGFNSQMCAEWIGLYNNTNSKNPDNVPTMKSLVSFIEKLRNQEGKSFLRDLEAEKEQYAIEQEMREIKAKAQANGTFMKAPNGKDTNLTERQWLQVRTKNFINWFGDWLNDPAYASKVVDENGEPLVLYRGGTKNKKLESRNGAYYLSPSKEYADSYTKQEGGKTESFFLNARNPREIKGTTPIIRSDGKKVAARGLFENPMSPKDILILLDNNDAVISNGEYMMANPNQIKSAADNNGMFSAENDSILASPAQYEEIPVELLAEIADEEASITALDSRESSDPDLNRKFGDKTEVSVSEMLNNLLANNTPFEGFVKALQENIGELGDIKIQLVPNSNSKVYGIAGLYSSLDNTIYINRNANYKGKDGKVDNTIIHEIIHAIVANSLNTPKHREELGKLFDEAKKKILNKYNVKSFEELPENLRKGRLYGLSNLDEFAAEFFTNSEFISELNDENTFGKRSSKKSLFSRLVEWIKSLLPKGVTDTYKRSGEILEDIILNSGGSIQTNRNLLAGGNNAANTQNIKLSTPESPLQVYSDGSDFKGTGKIGYGSVFELSGRQYGISGTEENEEVKKLQQQFPEAKFSNPTMEMLALATTLEYFASRGNGENIVINQDYKGACNYQGLWEYSEGSVQRDPKAWKAKEPYIKHLVDRSVAAIEKIKKDGGSVKINWVKGHQTAGTEQARMNDAADRYAKSRDNSNTMDDAYPKQSQQPSQTSTIDPRFKQGIETLTGYYEGGGRLITDDFPGVPNELDDKLNNHFMGGEELSDDDYRELAKYIGVVQNTDANTSHGWPYIAVPKQQTQQQSKFNVSQAEFYSGAAMGSDTAWATEARKRGIKVVEYTPGSWDVLSQEEKDKYDAEYREVVDRIGRKVLDINTYAGKLVRRDMMQADSADAIFAIGTIGSRGFVEGGTGYATTRGIIRGIPVFVYDRMHKQWKIWSDSSRKFVITSTPTLTPHAAVIGTRGDVVDKDDRGRDTYDIKEEEKQVIRDVLTKTVGQQPTQQPSSISSPSQAASLASSAAGAVSLGDVTPEEQAEAQRRYEEANAPQPKPVRPQSDSFKTALKVTENRTTQFYQTFTPQQIKDRGVMISDYFSDIIDDYILDELDRVNEIIENPESSDKDKEEARTLKNLLRDPINGRQYAANKIQIGNILSQIKDKIRRNVNNHDGVEKQLWQNTLDFFDELFNNQASLEIEEQEGIRIIGLKTIEKSPDDIANEEENDGNDETGHIVSGNDGWLFQTRFENPAASLSKRVRRMTYNIKRDSSDKDDLGHTRKYPSGQIYATLLSYLAKNMQNPDDFMQVARPEEYDGIYDHYGNEVTEELYPYGYPTFPVLETMRSQYPWVEQIINRLTDDYLDKDWNTCIAFPSTYGAMASQFYTNFRKVFIPYAKIQVGDGKFGVTPLNTEMEARCQKDKLAANFNNGIVMTDTCIYNTDTTINREHAEDLKDYIHDVIDDGGVEHAYRLYLDLSDPDSDTTKIDPEEFNKFLDRTVFLLNSFGISSNRENVVALLAQTKDGGTLYDMLKDLIYIADTISKVSDENAKNFNYLLDLHYVGGESVWGKFFEGRGMITDESYMQSFYDSASKKTRYSYSADNYLQKTFRGLFNPNLEERRAFIDEHYKKYEWFYNHKTNTWRNKWLEHLYNAQDISDVLPYRNINNITEYGETTKVRDYSRWSPSDVWLVQNRSFDSTKPYTFYLAPIFSDSPMSMTVKGPVLSNDEVLDALVGLVDQEMWRMKYVGEREAAIERGEIKPIANYDGKRGKEFCFIPELNDFTFENGETFLQAITRMKEGRAEDGSSAVYTKEDIENVEKQAIMAIMSQKADDYLAENRDQYDFENFDFNDFLGNYMNMVYANTSIIQLTTIDLAFHKDATEFQKRFKEVYAGGIQMNTNSRYGKKTENVVLLADDIITSPSYDSIAEIINNNSHLTDKEKERILNTFTDINVADAQAIRSMHSFRSVMDMMGRWDERAQEALEHFEKGGWNKEDFEVIYQTIKPFVYAVIDRNDGFGGVIPVPQQHKNSEICALMMYSLITNNLDSPVYRALSRFMETKDSNGEYLVDMIQFESAGKVGNQGVVNINYNPNKVMAALENEEYDFIPEASNTLENVDTNYKAIKKQMDKRLIDKKISQEDYNKVMQSLRPTDDEIVDMLNQSVLINNADGSKEINPEVVHTIPFDNYYQAQPTPEHHIDAEATFGSQGRNIAPADLPDNFELTLKVKGKNKTITLKGRDKVIDFYYELLDENLIEDFFGDGKNKKGLKGVFASKENLINAVTEIVRGNPKYGKDFIEALKLDSDGNFTISPNSPTMFTLMQELVTSLFKNRITKQKINGAALIQAAGIGLDDKLRLVKDAKGNIVGAQCLMPITSKEFFEPFMEERVINGRKEMVLNPEKLAEAGLDKAVGYRIPTENKSSMLPLIITGFTPLQNGSTIILPAEITALAGSDFDVDKMFVMLSEFYIQKYDMKAAREAWANENYVTTDAFSNSDLEENLSDEDPEEFKEWFKKNKEEFKHKKPQVKRVEYDWSKSPKENGRKARNNMIIQIIYGILTSGAGNQSLLNPQGFDNAKAAAKLHRIISDPTLRQQLFKNYASGITATVPSADQIRTMFLDAYKDMDPTTLASLRQSVNAMSDEDVVNAYIEKVALENDDIIDVLLNSSLKDREKFIKEYSAPESPIYPQTFAHSHAKNMAGSNQIGIYAIQGSMAAKYQRANITLKPNQQFVVNGRTLKDVDVSENGKRLKNVGEMIGASADNGKDPILSDAGSTTKTAPIIGYMLRLGLTHEEAVLIINQPFMKDVNYNPDRVDRAVKKMPVGDVSTKTLVKSILNPYSLTPIEQMNIIAMCYRILEQAKAMEGLTMISRADSPNGAMQNTFAKARVQQYMVERFNAEMRQPDFPFYPIREVINNNTVKVSEGEDAVREKLKAQPMAFLHAMYGLGINSLNDLASPYFFMLKKEFDDAIVKPILYNQNVTNKEHLENLVDDLYLEYITYALSVSPLFGEEQNADGTQVSMKSKRDYYLNSFADDFAKTLQENSAIREQLGSILQRDGNRVVLKDVGSLAKGQKDAISRRFDALMALGEEGQKLAKDLLLYAYYDSGLNFNHSSYSTRLSTYFLSQFPAFREILQQLDTPLTEELQKNFIHQFLITHKDAAYSVDNIINRETNVDEDIISVDMNDFKMNKRLVNTILSPDPRMTGVQPYPYISFDNYVYELDADAYDMNPSVAVYHKLEDYPTGDYRPIYNANKSLSQLAEEYNQAEPQQRPEEPSIDVDSNPDIAHNTGDENPDIDNSSDDNDEWGSISMSDVDAVESPGPASKSENYDIEGKSNLESPFC